MRKTASKNTRTQILDAANSKALHSNSHPRMFSFVLRFLVGCIKRLLALIAFNRFLASVPILNKIQIIYRCAEFLREGVKWDGLRTKPVNQEIPFPLLS